jgi:hypothetical protein
MSADATSTSSRMLPTGLRLRWLLSVTRGGRRSREEELELIERLERLEREARRSGATTPQLGPQRRLS